MKYNYKVKRQKFGPIKVEVQETNAKKETMVIELYECTNPGGKNSLPYLWYKEGWTETELETYLSMNTYVTDSEGNCRGAYSPTVKYSEEKKRFVLDFDWMLENTPENQEKLINEAVSRFMAATGKSATEVKLEKIQKFADENGVDVFREIPAGWTEDKHWMGDPYGTVRIINGQKILKKDSNGKVRRNPLYRTALLVL